MPVQGNTHTSNTFLSTKIGNDNYFINMSWVQSIERTDKLKILSPEQTVVGSILFERTELSVYSFTNKLGIGREEKSLTSERVVIIKKDDIRIGLLVNSVIGIVEVEKENVITPPRIGSAGISDYFESIVIHNNNIFLSISADFIGGKQVQTDGSDINNTGVTSVHTNHNGKNTATAGSNQILLFRVVQKNSDLSPYVFGLSISQVLQILDPLEILPVPGCLDFVYGLINWRNRPVPVIDIYRRIGLGESLINNQTRFVIARTMAQGSLICFPVHFDVNVKKLPLPHKTVVSDPQIHGLYSKGTFQTEEYKLLIPDLDNIVFSQSEAA